MAKNKSYNNIVFANKTLDKGLEIEDNTNMEAKDIREFTPLVKAYVHYFNVELQKYELFTIHIDPVSGETKLDRKTLDIDNEPRAIMEMQKHYSLDYIEKLKRK